MMRTLIFLSVVASVVLQAHFTAIPKKEDCGTCHPPDSPRCQEDHDDSCKHDPKKPCSNPHTDGCHPSEHHTKNKRHSCNIIECYELSLNLSGCQPQHNYQHSHHPNQSNSCKIDHILQYFELCVDHKEHQQRDHDKPCSHPHSNGSSHSGHDNRKNCRSDEVKNCFKLCQSLTESNQRHGKSCDVSDFLRCFSLCVNLTECSKNCQRNDNKTKDHDRPDHHHPGPKCNSSKHDGDKECHNHHYINCTERCLRNISIEQHQNCDHHDKGNSCPHHRLTKCIEECTNTTGCVNRPHHDHDHSHHDHDGTNCGSKHDERKKCLKYNNLPCCMSCLAVSEYKPRDTYDNHDKSKPCPRIKFLECYDICLNRTCKAHDKHDGTDTCKDDDDSETCRRKNHRD